MGCEVLKHLVLVGAEVNNEPTTGEPKDKTQEKR